MIRGALIAGLALVAAVGSANAQDNCQAIHFPRGKTSITIHGVAATSNSPDAPCYTFAAAAGQTATADVNGHMILSISDVGDDRSSWTFKTKAQTYKIIVAFEGRTATRDPFTLTLSIR